MKRIYTLLGFGFVASLSFSDAFGQTTIDGEFRPRTEFREGFRKPLADTLNAGLVTLQRTRFNADYKGKILNARISLQDARIWGNSDNKTNTSKVEIYEVWFEYLITSGLSAQMGRQPLKYDDQRLFAAPNWSNTGMAHDVLVLKYNSPFIQAHAGFAYNNAKDTLLNISYSYSPKLNYKTMGYAWMSKQLYKGITLSLIGICEGFEKPLSVVSTKIATTKGATISGIRSSTGLKDTLKNATISSTSTTTTSTTDPKIIYPRITYGGNLVYANDSSVWGATLTAYIQSGKNPTKSYGTSYASLNAYFLAAKVTYMFSPKLSANAGVDFYSGSDSSNISRTGKSKTFNRLYGATHSYNGYMEYFSTLPDQGLLDYYGGATVQIFPKLSADIAGHLFYFDKDFYYSNVKTDKKLGSEMDFTLTYKVSKEIAIQGGYSRYFNSGSTAQYYKMQGVDAHPQQWAYLMLTIRPQLYKTPPMPDSK